MTCTEAPVLPTKRAVEKALMALGFSGRMAKRFVAKGWPVVAADGEDELIEQLEALTARYRSVR